MMDDPFAAWIALQKHMLDASSANLDLAKRAMDAGKQSVAAQEATKAATEANLRMWRHWFDLWTPKK